MTVSQFDVLLRRVALSDIELIRSWRNSDRVRLNFIHRKHISVDQQKAWFNNIDNISNYYFLMMDQSRPIGVVDLRLGSMENGFTETGVFVGEPEYENSPKIPLFCLCIANFGLRLLQETQIASKVLKHNERAIKINKMLGLFPFKEFDDYYLFQTFGEQSVECLLRFHETVLGYFQNPDFGNMIISMDNRSDSPELIEFIQKRYNTVPAEFTESIKLEIT
ncbi:MAG: GNAT family N-acetyltransferase [Flavobacteriales bacterium]|nr:GNAT family N-acetyltransferase [Flavobacteriales bacterium]MCB9190264.1 GNAT family N-acetyltransferase [Flavobacteriales bacterium]